MHWQRFTLLLPLLLLPGLQETSLHRLNPLPSGLPNIVLLVADDLGWGDVGYHGSRLATPTLDQLARDGIVLDRFYASPICSPTRAGLLTGRYPIRFRMQHTIVDWYDVHGLPPEEDLLPEMLSRNGYTRRAALGKWHLGHALERYHPLNQGFTYFYGLYGGAVDHFNHTAGGQVDWHRNRELVREEGYDTDLIADEAIRFIQARDPGAPFFLYVAFTAPHTPLQAPAPCFAGYDDLTGDRRTYAAMVTCLDKAIGRIVQTLHQEGIARNTLLICLSDNGGTFFSGGNNRPLSGNKSSTREGGIRTPALMYWPGYLAAGRIVESPVAFVDLFPTLKQLVGDTREAVNELDGVPMWDALTGAAPPSARDVFAYRYLGPNPDEELMVLSGPWKLRRAGLTPLLQDSSGSTDGLSLYRIYEDPSELRDVKHQNPDVVDSLLVKLRRFMRLRPPAGFSRMDDPVAPPGWVVRKDWTMATSLLPTPVPDTSAAQAPVSLLPVLNWSAVTGAASYQLQVSTRPDFSDRLIDEAYLKAPAFIPCCLEANQPYYWRVRAFNARRDNRSLWSRSARFIPTEGVDRIDTEMTTYTSEPARPNPFASFTVIPFETSRPEHVVARLFDMNGRLVATVFDGVWPTRQRQGLYVTGQSLANERYLLRIEGETFATQQVIIHLR